MTNGTPDRTLSGNLGGMADRLAPYATSGIQMDGIAVHAIILLLLQCQALAVALENRTGGRAQDEAVVDLSGLISGGRRSAEVLAFPVRGA